MPLLKTNYTLEDIYALPEGERAELIQGGLFMMTPPNRRHQEIVGKLHFSIMQHIQSEKGRCKSYAAPFAVFLNADEETYVEPDISVICNLNKLDDRGCNGAPDFIIEVVSPSSRRMDYYTKLVLYRDAGVREYWIVDPIKGTVLVYLLVTSEAPVIYQFADRMECAVLEGLKITLEAIVGS